MRRNCNLELRLLPPSSCSSISQGYDDVVEEQLRTYDRPRAPPMNDRPQQLTIFYDGKVVSCDVTALQARAIIFLASQERSTSTSEPSSPLLQSQLYSPTTGLSMKRSLQRFLQKRKNRAQATSPYHR